MKTSYTLMKDWFDAPVVPALEVWLTVTETEIAFGARRMHQPTADNLPAGTFVEKLWEKDVVELFLGAAGGTYFEINLSPYGAYWSCLFSSYRTRHAEGGFPLKGVSCGSTMEAGTYSSQLHFPKISLPEGFVPQTFNIAAILDTPQRFLSLNPAPKGAAPDFHLATLRCDFPATEASGIVIK